MKPSLGIGIVLAALNAVALAASAKTEEGVRQFDARHLPEARAALEAAVREDPRDARAVYYLGRTLMAQSEPEKASEWLAKGIALDPNNSLMHLWLGRAWGQYATTVNVFKQASLAPKIKHEFERAVELDAANVDARFGLLEFYIQAPGVMGGSLEKARAQVGEIARTDRLRGYRAAARIAEYEKRFDAAIAEYERAAREFPDKIDPAVWTASLWANQKNFGKAFDALEAFLARNPSSMPASYQVGRLAALSGERLDAGAEGLKRYLTYEPKPEEPSLAAAHWRLGQILEKKGDRAGAKRAYEDSLKLDPSLKDVKEALKRLS